MNYLELIKKEIEKNFQEKINFSVEIPELEHGDVTTNVCLVASKILKQSPLDVANILLPKLENNLKDIVEKIEFKNPGFVNFYFKSEFVKNKLNPKKTFLEKFLPLLASPYKGEEQLKSSKYDGKKVLVEHTSVNLFKPFGIGHMMTNFTGEFIGRAIEAVGGKVIFISYPSDKSIGIAKAIWAIKKDGGLGQIVFQKSLNEIVKYLGQSYVTGVNAYKEAEASGESGANTIREVKDIANNIFNDVASEDLEIFNFAKEKNLKYFREFLQKLGSKFDNFIFESEAGEVGKKIILENVPNIFQESQGAIIYQPSEERKDINTSVFINSEGNPTYLAKDIGLLDLKFKKYPDLDYSIYVVDNEQNSHFKSVFDAGGKIKTEWEDKSVHVSHGRMTFKGNKMSSRLGGIPSGEEVINAVLEDVKEKSGGNENDLVVALSALRIAILRSKPGVNIDFDPDKASSFEGDSGPYLCYTHARCASLLAKGNPDPRGSGNYALTPGGLGGVTNIERKVLQFQNILKISAEEIAPQKLVKYLFELAGEFNNFYAHEKIISEDKNKTAHNLYLTKLVKETLQKGLHILGIEAPTKM